ncbi:MAG: hybrid-cluster NAD(P)-dependent oxidoreductase [Burkholderiaceae bacterium]|nr:hybrid-cluster NAD(P)-dependent oxidoreductase [Burkholderiaceae bacterium]
MNNLSQSAPFPVWQGGKLRCIARFEETHDSATFVLTSDTPSCFEFLPGQFVTVGFEIDGVRHYRAYSISSSPLQSDSLSITVKRVADGLVSNRLIDSFGVGDWLDALAPAGEFHLPAPAHIGPLVLLSAGSGITPMMSMTRWLLARQPDAIIYFIHSARSEQDIIFRDELLAMARQHRNFRLELFLSKPEGSIRCHAGRLAPERLTALVGNRKEGRFYLCGHPDYMQMVEDWYHSSKLPSDRLLKEKFSPDALTEEVGNGQMFQMSVPAFGMTADIADGQTLLEVMETESLPIIAACRSGMCGSCKCKVTEGQVERLSTATLTPEEVEAGYALACSTRANSSVTIELNA